jgi:hypothetical protein
LIPIGVPLVDAPEIGLHYEVGKLPYAVLSDAGGTVRAGSSTVASSSKVC